MKKLILLLVLLLHPLQAWAFPDNAVLDTFTGADGTSPPNANWTNGWLGAGTGAIKILGNGVTTTVTGVSGNAYWDTSTFGPNCEAYITISSVASGNIYQPACRLATIGANTTTGYSIVFAYPSTVNIYRRDTANVSEKLGATITKTMAAGDSVGIRTVGSNICAWHKAAAGSWAEIGCRVDATYPTTPGAAGYIGFSVTGSSAVALADGFGGGSVTACSGASPTWTATGLSQSEVNDCIVVATTGDTINLPAGTATWSTEVGSLLTPSVTVNKGITLHGDTVCSGSPVTCVDSTIILDGTGKAGKEDPLSITGTNARVTGISFQDPRNLDPADAQPEVTMDCSNCRFDHNSVIDTQTTHFETHGLKVIGRVAASQLVDHNYFRNLNGGVDPHGQGGGIYVGDVSWSTLFVPGDANATYIEDNNFDYTGVLDGAYDAYKGAHLVFRFNTVEATNIGGHGLDSGDTFRSVLRQEIYRNTFTNSHAAISQWFGTRGGFHVLWQNTVTGNYNGWAGIKNYRSDSVCTQCSSWGLCDGNRTNGIDQNTASAEGYACRDQVGRGPTTTVGEWPVGTTYSQPLMPVYSWDNLFKGSEPTIANYDVTASGGGSTVRVKTLHILNNRDFYVEVPSFDGSAGTGSGTSDPAVAFPTCTTGVAYFRTNVGSWNTSTTDASFNPSAVAGEDGLLYKCTATNTWTLYYTPYTYPHPLQAAALTAPTGLRVITQASGNSACLIWGASDMADLAGYRIYHGTSPSSYTLAADIPLNSVITRHMPDTQYCYASHVGGTHYFNMTAYNSDIVESSLATEVSATFTALSRTTASARGGSYTRDPLQ